MCRCKTCTDNYPSVRYDCDGSCCQITLNAPCFCCPDCLKEYCCYWLFPCLEPIPKGRGGRPYFSKNKKEILPLVERNQFNGSAYFLTRDFLPSRIELLEPDMNDTSSFLPDEARANFWIDQGKGEHASIASFALFSQKLLAIGAPMEMINESFLCAQEEMEHARLSFLLAAAYSSDDVPLAPKKYENHTVIIDSDIESLLISTLKEGCLSETMGAFQAAKKALNKKKELVKYVWSKIAIDEAYHASYAWRVVQWLINHDPSTRDHYLKVAKEVIEQELSLLNLSSDVLIIRELANVVVEGKDISEILFRHELEENSLYYFVFSVLQKSVVRTH